MSDGGIAQLGMYDWPQVRAATDRLWACLRDALREEGMPAPELLDRESDPQAAWLRPDLVLAQACGLPFVRRLRGRVTMLGAPDYGLKGAGPGEYYSEVVVRGDDPRDGLAAFRGARLAFNAPESQSGAAAILHHAAPLGRDGRFFGDCVETGTHVEAIRQVAAGAADIAAIDAVSWRMARVHLPEAAGLRVLTSTDPTPGLPLIAAVGADATACRRALARGFARLDAAARSALGLAGFRGFDAGDYAVIEDRLVAAVARLDRDPLVRRIMAPSDSFPA